jgi:hypothetical protein
MQHEIRMSSKFQQHMHIYGEPEWFNEAANVSSCSGGACQSSNQLPT